MPNHPFAHRLSRPARPAPLADWGRLGPVAGLCWVDLLPRDAPDGLRVLYAMLDAGMLEAWKDQSGHVRLRAPDGGEVRL